MSTSKQTHNHDEIKKWVEAHDGVPAVVKGTGNGKGDGVLRIHFPDHSDDDDKFTKVSWDDFFEEFDKNKLDFIYQEKKQDGEPSTFHKFVERK